MRFLAIHTVTFSTCVYRKKALMQVSSCCAQNQTFSSLRTAVSYGISCGVYPYSGTRCKMHFTYLRELASIHLKGLQLRVTRQ